MKFDLFQLHQKEDEQGSMSYILVKGNKVGGIVIDLVWKIVKKRNINKKILLIEISRKIKVSYGTIERQITRIKNYSYWISLAFLKELLNKYRQCFPEKDIKSLKNLLISSFEKIKVSNGRSLELKTVKKLSVDLCTLAGAHAADGCLYKYKHRDRFGYAYIMSIVDREYEAINWYKNCLYNLFGLRVNIRKLKGSWLISTSNKIIFRYLSLFFKFPVGKKSVMVREPAIIKHSSFSHRKAFLKGVMTFDGSVTSYGAITLGMKSKLIINSACEILKKDQIRVNNSFDKKAISWHLKTTTRLKRNQLNRWLSYFIDKTEKHRKTYELLYGYRKQPRTISDSIKAFACCFPKDNKSKITIADVLKVMVYNKELFIWEITEKLIKEKNLTCLSYTPVKMYLYVLENKANIVKSKMKLVKFRRNAAQSKLYSLNKFIEWRIPDVRICP